MAQIEICSPNSFNDDWQRMQAIERQSRLIASGRSQTEIDTSLSTGDLTSYRTSRFGPGDLTEQGYGTGLTFTDPMIAVAYQDNYAAGVAYSVKVTGELNLDPESTDVALPKAHLLVREAAVDPEYYKGDRSALAYQMGRLLLDANTSRKSPVLPVMTYLRPEETPNAQLTLKGLGFIVIDQRKTLQYGRGSTPAVQTLMYAPSARRVFKCMRRK
jgi:hypothetical protein